MLRLKFNILAASNTDMKIKALILLLLLPVVLFSCRKCYDCEKYTHCYSCTISYDFSPDTYENACFETPAERDSVMAEIVSIQTSQGNTANCTKSEDLIVGFAQEVCGGKNKSEEETSNLTTDGYICVEK